MRKSALHLAGAGRRKLSAAAPTLGMKRVGCGEPPLCPSLPPLVLGYPDRVALSQRGGSGAN